MNKKAEKYNSTLIAKLLAERDPIETAKTKNRMLLAAKIDDAMKAKGWNKTRLSIELGKEPSVITKWLSGTHNFTADTLTEIGLKLGIDLFNASSKEEVVRFGIIVFQKAENNIPISNAYESLIGEFSFTQQLTAEC